MQEASKGLEGISPLARCKEGKLQKTRQGGATPPGNQHIPPSPSHSCSSSGSQMCRRRRIPHVRLALGLAGWAVALAAEWRPSAVDSNQACRSPPCFLASRSNPLPPLPKFTPTLHAFTLAALLRA